MCLVRVAVSHQLLDHAQLGAAVEEVRGERVTQEVRVNARVDARGQGVLLHDQLDTALAEPRAVAVDEDRRRRGCIAWAGRGAPPLPPNLRGIAHAMTTGTRRQSEPSIV